MRVSLLQTGILVFFISLGIALNSELMPNRRSQFLPGEDEISFTWNSKLFKIMQFGHATSAVDWLLIKFLTNPSWKHVEEGKRAKIYYDIDLATDLDPAFFSLYLTGAQILTVVRNDNAGAIRILDKAENFRINRLPKYPESFRKQYWSEAWRIPFLMGFIQLFEMHNLKKAKESLEIVNQFPESPEYLKKLHLRLSTLEGRYEVGERILNGMLASAKQENDRKSIENKIENLRLSLQIALLNQGFNRTLISKYGDKSKPAQFKWSLLKSMFIEFMQKNHHSLKDQLGGQIYINENGKINTTTKRESIFELD